MYSNLSFWEVGTVGSKDEDWQERNKERKVYNLKRGIISRSNRGEIKGEYMKGNILVCLHKRAVLYSTDLCRSYAYALFRRTSALSGCVTATRGGRRRPAEAVNPQAPYSAI